MPLNFVLQVSNRWQAAAAAGGRCEWRANPSLSHVETVAVTPGWRCNVPTSEMTGLGCPRGRVLQGQDPAPFDLLRRTLHLADFLHRQEEPAARWTTALGCPRGRVLREGQEPAPFELLHQTLQLARQKGRTGFLRGR